MSERGLDAVVVGASLAGSAAALVLARAGARVAVVDKAEFPRAKTCGELLSPDGVAVLARLGLDGAVRAAGVSRPSPAAHRDVRAPASVTLLRGTAR